MIDETSLDPDFLDEQSKTNIEDYTCCICQLIPDPETSIEEENCGHIFCFLCINQWLNKSEECPFCKMKITKRSIKDKNKIVYRHLINLVVLCQEENCSWKGIFKDYSDHLKNSHKKILKSSNLSISNIKTNNTYTNNTYDNNTNDNNNYTNYSTNNNINFNNNFELYKYYKSTTHNHPLKYLDTTMSNGWRCDGIFLPNKCQSGITDFHQTANTKRFRCIQCNYDLCDKCMNRYYDKNFVIKNDNSNNRGLYLFEKKYKTEVHKHPLVFLDKSRDNGWGCDGRNLINGCFSGITGFHQSQGLPRFRCEECDFDLCENCMNFYKKKIYYEINHAYKTSVHKHNLVFLGKNTDGDWKCDGTKLETKCLSNITDFYQTKGHERFRCELCDFDLCRNCMDFYYTGKKGCIIF